MTNAQVVFQSDDLILPTNTFCLPSEATTVASLTTLIHKLSPDIGEQTLAFTLNDEFICESLDDAIDNQGLSRESVLTVKVIPTLKAPEREADVQHPDWISAVSIRGDSILTACYDGVCRVYLSKSLVEEFQCDESIVTAAWASKGSIVCGTICGSVWQRKSGDTVRPELIATVDDIKCILPVGDLIIAGSSSGEITALESGGNVIVQEKAHNGKVSDLALGREHSFFSASFDHRIIHWSLEGDLKVLQTFASPAAINAICVSPSGKLVVSAHSDNHIRVWDVSDGSCIARSGKAHSLRISSLSWCPLNEYNFASVGHDSRCCVWDLRSISKPVHSFATDGRHLSVAWSSTRIVSGGETGLLTMYSCSP